MFEFSIALSEQKADSAKKLYKEIKSTASSFGAVETSYSENGKIFIVVACDDIEKPRISFFICDAIADIITTDFKLDYINKNLHLQIHNQLNLDALKKALVVKIQLISLIHLVQILRLQRKQLILLPN